MEIFAAIVGVQKCGTTSLLRMLSSHPEIVTHFSGQWPYFLHDDNYREQYQRVCQDYFPSDIDKRKVLIRDTSISASDDALRRLRELSPNVKLVFVTREPASRAYSAFCFANSKGYEKSCDFSDFIRGEEVPFDSIEEYLVHSYVRLGFYYQTLSRIERYFPKERIFVLRAEDLKADPVACCNRIFQFFKMQEFEVYPCERNQTHRPRWALLQKYLKRSSASKRFAKRFLPLRARQLILQALHQINTSNRRYEDLPLSQRRRLESIYESENLKLEQRYGIVY